MYFPAREADPATGKVLDTFVELPDKGIVTTFAIINIPFAGQKIKPPYVAAYILLDGADIPFLHLVSEIDAADVRMGMKVAGGVEAQFRTGLRHRQHRVLPADRRTGRRVRHLQAPPVKRLRAQ